MELSFRCQGKYGSSQKANHIEEKLKNLTVIALRMKDPLNLQRHQTAPKFPVR